MGSYSLQLRGSRAENRNGGPAEAAATTP